MRKVNIKATWVSFHEIDVPDGAPGAGLPDDQLVAAMPEWMAEQINTATADLASWELANAGG